MRLDRIQPGDVIKAAIKGRTGIWGEVTEIKDGTHITCILQKQFRDEIAAWLKGLG